MNEYPRIPGTAGSLGWPLQAAQLEVIADFDAEMLRRLGEDSARDYLPLIGGLALLTPPGTPVVAMLDGVAQNVAFEPNGLGNRVTLDHSAGIHTVYGHFSKSIVRKGQRVTQGESIIYTGNTGLSIVPHLYISIGVETRHFGTAAGGQPTSLVNINPLGFLKPGPIVLAAFPD